MHVTKGKWKLIFIDLSDLNLWHRRAQQTHLVDKRGVFFHISSEKVWAEPLDPGARGWTRRHCQRNEKYFSSNRFYLICKSTLVLFSGGQLKWRCHLIGRWRQSFQFPAVEAWISMRLAIASETNEILINSSRKLQTISWKWKYQEKWPTRCDTRWVGASCDSRPPRFSFEINLPNEEAICQDRKGKKVFFFFKKRPKGLSSLISSFTVGRH